MHFKANAKINLGLFISAKRPDGYHELESLFLPIPWCDEIQFEESEEFNFSSSGIEIPHDSNGNLVSRAYQLLKKDFDLPNISIHLKKQVPIGAGLGGGSSDAAHMLKALNEYFKLGLNNEKLAQYALELGSDCPFFIENKAAIASGRGELLEQVDLPKIPNKLLMVVPPLHISTAKAYSLIKPKQAEHSIKEILKMPFEDWQSVLINDFEGALRNEYPVLQEIRKKLLDSKASFVSMSGSGSAFYAFYENWNELPNFPEDYNVQKLDLA
ncbi:MAG: 4-(cytidine 5'-diphospho)-2-C-methyl-D-erythritol kinase [Flavobacteriales bacterium]|nr:4-(cytidine 5'-diphospho)-2-C-methyl-D-erythritol kinase [Flavobacteriales bacterium]